MSKKLDYAHMAKVLQEKAEVFRGYHKDFKGVVCMSRAYIDVEPECGTVACVGGWLAHHYQTTSHLHDSSKIKKRFARGFGDGADAFARELGFFDHYALEDWAHYRPNLWGNHFGCSMFSGGSAYGVGGRKLTLEDVADHWEEVADKLEAEAA